MFTLKSLPEFEAWLTGLRDPLVHSAVMKRLTRVELGLLGDARSLGDGAFTTPNAAARSSFFLPAVQSGSSHATSQEPKLLHPQ